MYSIAIGFLLALVTTAIITPWVRTRALHWNVVDDPTRARKIHKQKIPRMGGLAIAVGFFVALLVLLALETDVATRFSLDVRRVLGLFGGSILMLAIGLYDDIFGADAKKKLLVQSAAAALLIILGFQFSHISLPWGGEIHLGIWGIPLTFIWIVGLTNAINLIDGLDGLAAGVCFFAMITLGTVCIVSDQVVAALIAAALSGALLGFLFHNFHPATIFMGDTGSLFIGFVVSATGLMTNTKSSTTVALLIPILALGLPIMDTTLAAFRRVLRSQSPFSPDQEHIHHRLLQKGFSHRSTVLALWGACVLACGTALAMVLTKGHTSLYVLLGFAVIAFTWVRSMGYVRIEEWFSIYQTGRKERRKSRGKMSRVRAILRSVHMAQDMNELSKALKPFHRMHQYAEMSLIVYPSERNALISGAFNPEQTATPLYRYHWETDKKHFIITSDKSRLMSQFDLGSRQRSRVVILYTYRDGRTRLHVEDEVLFQRMHESIAYHTDRIYSGIQADETEHSEISKIVPLRRKS